MLPHIPSFSRFRFLLHRVIPHNASMPFFKAPRPLAFVSSGLTGKQFAFALRLLSLILSISILFTPTAAKARPVPALEPGYVLALTTVDHFLQAWQSGDTENGMALLTSHAKETATTDVIERFFANSTPSAYEIGRGKLLKRGRYEFPVVLVTASSKNNHARRRFSSIIVLHSGDNDWAVDKLP
jgi:hypothetical protein